MFKTQMKMIKFNLKYTAFIFITCSLPFHAQINNSDSTDNYFDSRIKEIGHQLNYSIDDGVKLFERTTNFDNTDLIYSAAFVLGTAASFSLDKEIRNMSARNQNSAMNSITNVGEKYGNGLYSVLLSAGLFTTGLLSENKKIENTGRILFEALLVSGAAVQLIKIVSGRSRPFLDEGPFMFNFFKTDNPHTSFPSGHTVVAFATSSVLAASIKNTYASIALYSLAGLTAYQRMYSNNHWFSDTVLAAIIGTVVGNALVKINDDRFDEKNNENKLSVHPLINQFGIHLNFSMHL
jgi:hypothetical protein